MNEIKAFLRQIDWRIIIANELATVHHNFAGQRMTNLINETIKFQLQESPLRSFALDDALCQTVGNLQSIPSARFWSHQKSVVLGFQDTRLPMLSSGIEFLKDAGYEVIVRNSGGLAVVVDEGIVNLSIILSEQTSKIEINRGYDIMLGIIKLMFANYDVVIKAGEVVGSYCPGSYDVSIEGKKFAGISQRRIRGGVAVQTYLAVTGSGSERAELIRQFYELSGASSYEKFNFPNVIPAVSASLAQLITDEMTVEMVINRFINVFKNYSNKLQFNAISKDETELLATYVTRLINRNEKAFDKSF